MSDKPQDEKPLDPKQVDYVALKQRTTRAQAVWLLRHGYELPADWQAELPQLYAAEVLEDDVVANANAEIAAREPAKP